jgi:pimeloyl-ACP methyl ester carboxylesterase
VNVQPLFENGHEQQPGRHRKHIADEASAGPAVLAIGAAGSLGDFVPTQVREYATNVTGVVIANSGHWIFEEQPAELTQRVLQFLK